jgi:hypothetical protein
LDHVLENDEVIISPFIDSPQTLPVSSRLSSSKSRTSVWLSYAIETVKNAKGGIGVVRAIFTTMEGCQRYAIEDEGALDFVDEASLSRISKTDLAAAKHS